MSTERPLLSRPIVVSSTNDTFSVTVSSTPYAVSLTNGVYPCVRRIAYEIDQQATSALGVPNTWSVSFNPTTYKFALEYTGGGTWNSISWTDTALRDLLGYTGSESITSKKLTATYCPSSVWFPTFQPADQGAWQLEQDALFSGVTCRNGRNVGNQTGPAIYSRTFDFVHELAEKCFCEFAADAYEAERSFEKFILYSRVANNNSGDVSSKGFYLYHDMADALTAATATLDDGGVTWQYTSSPETYVYCHPETDGARIGGSSMPNARQRYNINGFRVHTASAPTWVTIS